jgi:two-component system response regulator
MSSSRSILLVEDNPDDILPVVVLTSSDEEKDLLESYGQGCDSYVRKPVSYNEFVEAARQLGVYWLVLDRAPPAAVRG